MSKITIDKDEILEVLKGWNQTIDNSEDEI